jgi:hypothetical protein
VVAKHCCHVGFMMEEFVWLIAQHFNPVLVHGISRAFLDYTVKIEMGSHPVR